MVLEEDSSAGLKALRALTTRFYRVRGLARLAEKVRRANVRRPRTVVVDDFDGASKFTCHLHSHIGSYIFWRGWYSREQLELLGTLLRPDSVFVDIGANEGEHTVFAARRVPRGRVVAFEPVTALHERLAANVRLNGFRNVELVKLGLSDQAGTLPIYTQAERFTDGSLHEGLSTLYPTGERRDLIERIDLVSLDDYAAAHGLDRVDVVKIDVEGAELAILHGARRLLERTRPVVLMEVNEETSRAAGYQARRLLEFFAELGYRFEVFAPDGRLRPVTADTLSDYQDVVCYPAGS